MNHFIVEWIQLFDICVKNIHELKEQCKDSIEEEARLIVELEVNFIDKMFEMGDLENLKADDLKEFIKKARTNSKLKELGYEGIFEFDKEKSENLDWFYHLTVDIPIHVISSLSDLLIIVKEANEGEDWDDLF